MVPLQMYLGWFEWVYGRYSAYSAGRGSGSWLLLSQGLAWATVPGPHQGHTYVPGPKYAQVRTEIHMKVQMKLGRARPA